MIRAWRWWVEFVAREESGECLAAMRVLTALTLLLMVLDPIVFGLVEPLYYPSDAGGFFQSKTDWWLVELLGGPTPSTVWTLLITTIVAALALGLGVGARVAALVAGQCVLALRGISGMQGSYATLASNALWLLVFARSDVTHSLACRLRTGSWTSDEPVPAWPRFIAVFQLIVVYTWTGLAKISVAWIGDFSALYYILQTPTWSRFELTSIGWWAWATRVSTALVWFWEVTFGVLLLAAYFRETAERPGRLRAWFNRHDLRVPYGLFGFGAHVMIAASMVVGPFFLATISFYPALFAPSEWRAGFTRIRARIIGS